MVEPVLVCVPRRMVCHRPGAAGCCQRTQILLGTGGGGGEYSFDGWIPKCAPVMCRDFAPKVDPDQINRSSDLMNRFSLLCADGGDDVSSCGVSLGLFDRALSQPALSDMDILGSRLLVSVDTGVWSNWTPQLSLTYWV